MYTLFKNIICNANYGPLLMSKVLNSPVTANSTPLAASNTENSNPTLGGSSRSSWKDPSLPRMASRTLLLTEQAE